MGTAVTSDVRITPLTASFGAIVEGLDTTRISDDQAAALHRLVVDHGVVALPGQDLSDDGQLALAARWGELAVFPPLRCAGQVVPLEWVEDTVDSPPKAFRWHSDLTWEPTPPKFGMLWADVAPDAGGDTVFADTAAAYDALSPTMRECLAPLRVRHRIEPGALERLAKIVPPEAGERFKREFSGGVEQPLVRRNPDTGRDALFIAGYWMECVVGMNPTESEALLRFLMDHATQPRFQCRWRWTRRDLVIWDERRSLHCAMSDHYPRHRKLRRVTVVGEVPIAASPTS